MTNQHTLLVVHGAPPVSQRDPALVARLRRYFHPGNVLRSWTSSASFHNWVRGALRDEASIPPIAMVITSAEFNEVHTAVHAAFRRQGAMPPWDFQWMVADWASLVRELDKTQDGAPLKLEERSGIEFTPLATPTGKYHGYQLSGPFRQIGSTNPAHQAVYALEWIAEQERYRGVKVSGLGGRVLHWEEADIADMVRLGYIRHHLAVRTHIAQLHAGHRYDAAIEDISRTFFAARDRDLMTHDDMKKVIFGLGVRKTVDIAQGFSRYNLLAFLRAVIAGTNVRERLRILYGLPFGGHRMALICSEAQREAIRVFDEKDIKADAHNVPLPGFVRLRAPEPVVVAKTKDISVEIHPIVGEFDNTSWTRVIREHAGAHYRLASTRWDISWNGITGFYEAERSEDKTIVACIRPHDLANMIAVGKLVAVRAGATTPYPDLDTFNQRVMNFPKERKMARNGIVREIVKKIDIDVHGTLDIPSNKRKAIMDALKYHLDRYELISDKHFKPAYIDPRKTPGVDKFSENILRNMAQATGLSYEELTAPIPPTINTEIKVSFDSNAFAALSERMSATGKAAHDRILNTLRNQAGADREDVYAKFALEMRNTPIRGEATGERKVGMPPALGMPYASTREAILGKEGAQTQRDESAKREAEAKAAAFPCVVYAGDVTVRGEKKRLIARVSHVTAGVISATMVGTNSWRKGQDNTHLELIRNAQIDRTHFGYEKYGVTLDRDDLSLAQLDQHAFEEALDLVCYLRARVRAMNKISGNGAEYGPDEEWIEPLVRDARALLEGLACQVLRTNPEANKLSQYVELEEPFSDAGKNRLFEDLKSGKLQTVIDRRFSPSSKLFWGIPCKADFSGGVYSGKDGGGVFGERGPEMVISKSQAERFEEKLKNFRASYGCGPIKELKMRVEPMTDVEAAEMLARFRKTYPNLSGFWGRAILPEEVLKNSGLLGELTEVRGPFWVTKDEAEYLDAQPKYGKPGYRPTPYCLDWYRNKRTISHAEAMRRSNPTNTKDEPMNESNAKPVEPNAPKSGVDTDVYLAAAQTYAQPMNWLVESMHGLAVNAGWWHDLKTGELKSVESEFGTKIALIHSEVSEALEGQRKNLMDEYLPHRKAVEVELADAVIRIGDLAGRMGLDLGGAIAEKLAFNASRLDHKPENRAAEGGKSF